MKKLIAIVLCLVMVVAAVACTSKPATETKTETKTETAAQGKVFNIYAWNEEFKGSQRQRRLSAEAGRGPAQPGQRRC